MSKGIHQIFLIVSLIIVLTFEVITGIKFYNQSHYITDYTQTTAYCVRNNLLIGSIEDGIYVLYKADYEYTVGTKSYGFSKYQFLKKTIALSDECTVNYFNQDPSKLQEDTNTLVVKLLCGLTIAGLLGFLLYHYIVLV